MSGMNTNISTENRYNVEPPQPRIVGPDYVQSVDNMTAQDFMKIYIETLRYQDPFNQQDISKAIDDMVKLNQMKFFTEMKLFMDDFKAWMNQLTFMQTLGLIGKTFVFQTDTLDTLRGGEYFIFSGERMQDVTVKIYDGDEVIKEFTMDIERGLNPLDISDLPNGQFTVKFFRDDLEIDTLQLGFRDTVTSVGIVGGDLVLDLGSGRQAFSSQIIYAGG